MEKEILYNNECVGTAQLLRNGLYYDINCCCKPRAQAKYRIVLCGQDKTIDLGTCLYDAPNYHISTRLPAKQLDDTMQFLLICKESIRAWFYPIVQGMPFEHIDLLPQSKLMNLGDVIGITNQE